MGVRRGLSPDFLLGWHTRYNHPLPLTTPQKPNQTTNNKRKPQAAGGGVRALGARESALASSLLASLSPLNAHFGWEKKTT